MKTYRMDVVRGYAVVPRAVDLVLSRSAPVRVQRVGAWSFVGGRSWCWRCSIRSRCGEAAAMYDIGIRSAMPNLVGVTHAGRCLSVGLLTSDRRLLLQGPGLVGLNLRLLLRRQAVQVVSRWSCRCRRVGVVLLCI